MAEVWSFIAPRPATVPVEQVHILLYSYFPSIARGAPRPYVWRLLSPDRVGVISAMRPTAAKARCHELAAGTTLEFSLTYKRVRSVNGGERYVTISSMTELRERLIAFAGQRGAAIGYVRLDKMRDLQLSGGDRNIRIPIVDACGAMLVTDAERCAGLLASGGPGTGKAFGCGAWWIPQIMEADA